MGYEVKDKNGKVVVEVETRDGPRGPLDEGVWVTVNADDGTRPTLAFVKHTGHGYDGEWYLGVYRDTQSGDPHMACDLAVLFTTDRGPVLQVAKGGKFKTVDLYELIEKVGL